MDLNPQTAIWNRAAMAGGGSQPRPGDIALASVLTFHGMVMSGGLDHAFEVLGADVVAAAKAGFLLLNLADVATVIGQAELALTTEDEDQLELLDGRYNSLIPRDAILAERFEKRLEANPEDFAPTES